MKYLETYGLNFFKIKLKDYNYSIQTLFFILTNLNINIKYLNISQVYIKSLSYFFVNFKINNYEPYNRV